MTTREDVSEANRSIFDGISAVSDYHKGFRSTGFLDAGERAALLSVADAVRGQPALDLGVGAGRTTTLLRLLTDHYDAADYAPRMVAEFHHNFPELPVRVADARDLGDYPDDVYALTLFSNNAIDAVGRAERPRVLRELARVTRPGGYLIFSTLHRGGPSYAERPLQLRRPTRRFSLRQIVIDNMRLLARPGRALRAIRSWRANRARIDDHGSWAVGPLAAHEFGLIVHFTTYEDLIDLLHSTGLSDVVVFDESGLPIAADADAAGADSFTVVARVPAA
ncbi:class I SAM-dependent methyltransferase [Millisia brevis]|uniref:class I SAM-dependent methyltransferase n=1 Tax=Millisia brevis TaxID=264148 RepID=UPI00082F1673|nr:methyltransferase domain-containing protein [Millisia brevis]